MKLLGMSSSPYVRKVRIALEEKNIPHDYVIATPLDPESGVAAANPLEKIPALVRDDGKGLYDSSVIVEYLDGVSAPRLIPERFADRIEVRRWEALGNGITEALVLFFHGQIAPDHKLSAWEAERQFKKIRTGLAAMEQDLGGREFCHGDSFTLADIVCGVALGYADIVLEDFNWRALYPGLKRHYDRLSARPSFIKAPQVRYRPD